MGGYEHVNIFRSETLREDGMASCFIIQSYMMALHVRLVFQDRLGTDNHGRCSMRMATHILSKETGRWGCIYIW